MANKTFLAPADAKECKIYGQECLVYNGRVLAVWDMLVGYMQLDGMPCPVSTYRRRARQQMLQDVARDLCMWAGYRVPDALSIVQAADACTRRMQPAGDTVDRMLCVSLSPTPRAWVESYNRNAYALFMDIGYIPIQLTSARKPSLSDIAKRIGRELYDRRMYPGLYLWDDAGTCVGLRLPVAANQD